MVNSILSQSFADFELLLIDDGSSDGGGEVCDALAGSDSRIKVFTLPTKGFLWHVISGLHRPGANMFTLPTLTTGFKLGCMRPLLGQ